MRDWIIDLASGDKSVRIRAGNVLKAMELGVPSVYTDLERRESDDEAGKLFPQKVREVFADPSFPGCEVLKALIQNALRLSRLHIAHVSKQSRHEGGEADSVFADDEMCTPAHMISHRIIEEAAGVVPAVLGDLTGILEREDTETLMESTAVKALGNMGSAAKSAYGMLFRRLCESEDGLVAASMAKIISEDRQAITELRSLLYGRCSKEAHAAIRVLMNLREVPDITVELKALSKHGDEKIQGAAAAALGKMGRERADVERLLLEMVDKEKGHNRSQAIESLALVCDKPEVVVPILIDALDDPDYCFCRYEGCVESAAKLLWRFAEYAEDAIPSLTKYLEELEYFENVDDSLERITLLGKLGAKAQPAVHVLKRHLEMFSEFDEDSEIPRTLRDAIEKIEQG